MTTGIRIYLVRHGQAAANWFDDPDPGLNDKGIAQARAMAEILSPLGPLNLVTSPMRRARETAEPLAEAWTVTPKIVEAVSEVPSPDIEPALRRKWLKDLFFGTWSEAGPDLRKWRGGVIETLASLSRDTVVVSHYVAINAAVGEAQGSDKVLCFHPDNASATCLENDQGKLKLIKLGRQAGTTVL